MPIKNARNLVGAVYRSAGENLDYVVLSVSEIIISDIEFIALSLLRDKHPCAI